VDVDEKCHIHGNSDKTSPYAILPQLQVARQSSVQIGVARGAVGALRAEKNILGVIYREGEVVSAPPAHQVHAQAEQEHFRTFFLLGGEIWKWEWLI